MAEKKRKQKRDYDFAVTAFRVVQESTRQLEPQKESPESSVDKHAAAVALGRLGGLKGGKARASKMTAKQRKEIARIAANARWKKSRT